MKLDKKEKDVIDVIYQQINCIVHLGGCYKTDKNIKGECKGPAYCREFTLGLEELNRELSRMLTRVIGRFVDIEFEFSPETPENLKR